MVTLLYQTPIFEWYMARLEFKKETSKATCYVELGVCTQNTDTIPGSIVNMIGRVYIICSKEKEHTL